MQLITSYRQILSFLVNQCALESFAISLPISTMMLWILDAMRMTTYFWVKKRRYLLRIQSVIKIEVFLLIVLQLFTIRVQ